MLRKDFNGSHGRMPLPSLHVGSTVGFGFLPQTNISGRRLTVKAINTYTFDEDVLPSYVLDNGGNDINLMIACDDMGAPHLSISQRVEERLFLPLFLSHQPKEWFLMKDADILRTSHRVMGMQQSWVASEYRLATTGKGILAEGDCRVHGKPYYAALERHFDYVMLVDKMKEHSLEAEKYEDGTLIAYSTVYRPMTDIGEITGEPPTKIFGGWDSPPKLKIPSILEHGAFDKILLDKKLPLATTTSPEPLKMSQSEDPTPELDKKRDTHGDVLSLDTRLAVCIIEEAKKNKTSLAEVIRKVIDLPAVIHEQVMIGFSLSDAEYTELAERYKLSPLDHENIRKNIVQELQNFAGNKK